MTSSESNVSKLPSLKITCTSTDCKNGLHCYIQKKKQVTGYVNGPCRDCGENLVDWDRVHTRNLADTDHTFLMLKTELIRHHFWHVEIDEKAIKHARGRGRIKMYDIAMKQLRRAIGPAKPFRDGIQTPKTGKVIYYAQHATATCCRKCVEEWHGIPRGRELTEDELVYMAKLVMLYINERLPSLTENGEKVPSKKKTLVSAEQQKRQHKQEHPETRPSDSSASPTVPSPSQQLLAAVKHKQQRGKNDDD